MILKIKMKKKVKLGSECYAMPENSKGARILPQCITPFISNDLWIVYFSRITARHIALAILQQ